MAKHDTPQNNVAKLAISIRPYRSLMNPKRGLPSAVPRFINADIAAALDDVRPIDTEKSDNEYILVRY
jgi:hypothetical protein